MMCPHLRKFLISGTNLKYSDIKNMEPGQVIFKSDDNLTKEYASDLRLNVHDSRDDSNVLLIQPAYYFPNGRFEKDLKRAENTRKKLRLPFVRGKVFICV